jgi:superfamily II DNA or RNA helicase
METLSEINRMLAEAESELSKLNALREELLVQLAELRQARAAILHVQQDTNQTAPPTVTNQSSPEAKIDLFRSLFRGRDDVYARRFESRRTGKTGYQPVCRNEWVSGICKKPRGRCDDCAARDFPPITDDVVRNHLLGVDPHDNSRRDFTMGVYPMLLDETCWFLAVDLDKASWQEDAKAFWETCEVAALPIALERSRSGNGAHFWFFFAEPIPAALARRMGALLLSQTMERRPEIGLDSYDRFFPSQDTLPKGGFGNLIALPLQKKPREHDNSVFLDGALTLYPDQWAFLSSIRRISRPEVESLVESQDEFLGVRLPVTDEHDDRPWTTPPSRRSKAPPVVGPLPEHVDLVLGNQVYVPKPDLTPSLRSRLIRLAAFQNPEFYRAQAMRFSTFGKPRVISCCEEFPKHLGLPRGCLDELLDLLESLKVDVTLSDQRFGGILVALEFHGTLRAEQKQAADALLQQDIGVLSASTAFGKTVVAAYLIAQRKVNTLVVVHRQQLLDQWIQALSKFLGLTPDEIGQIGGGKRNPTERIDVAMIQSLYRKGIVDDIVDKYGCVIVDECHHISAVSFEQVVRQTKARYITGLSATVTRKDGHHPIIFMQCGPVRYRVDARRQAEKRPFDHKVIVRPTSFRLPPYLESEASYSIQEVYSLLAQNEERNNLIVQDVVAATRAKRFPVLMTERREHVEVLADLLAPHIPNVFVMRGGMGKRQRQKLAEQVASVPSDEPRVIVATGRYLGEGFDNDELDTLFMASPISWRGTLTQYAGRLHRLHEAKKEVLIYDYVDVAVPVLNKMYSRRRAGYKAIGYEIVLPETNKHQPQQLALQSL